MVPCSVAFYIASGRRTIFYKKNFITFDKLIIANIIQLNRLNSVQRKGACFLRKILLVEFLLSNRFEGMDCESKKYFYHKNRLPFVSDSMDAVECSKKT